MTTKRVKIDRKLGKPWEEVRDKLLKDWKSSRIYLRMALHEGGLEEFLGSLREVAQAVGVANLAKRSGLTRQAVYKILSEGGNPHARSLWQIVEALGLKFDLVEEKKAA
jgi:probable addiction module antidote protein